jgi:predicted ATP-dependent Lon-type protease
MKQTTIACNCGSKLCHTNLIVKEDEEAPKNIMLVIKNSELSKEFFVSLDKDSFNELIKAGLTKFGRK